MIAILWIRNLRLTHSSHAWVAGVREQSPGPLFNGRLTRLSRDRPHPTPWGLPPARVEGQFWSQTLSPVGKLEGGDSWESGPGGALWVWLCPAGGSLHGLMQSLVPSRPQGS